jgi:hypothetical protein
MDTQHRIEVFTEGCSSCEGAIAYGHELASSSRDYEVRVWDVKNADGSARVKELGITDLPAIAIDGEPLACCQVEGKAGA